MRSTCAVIVGSALLLPCGCASTSTAKSPTATIPVKGKVTFNGKPLSRGTVQFEPEGAGREAFGQIQKDGTFVLTTYQKDDGAVPGHHRVAITNGGPLPLKFQSYGSSRLETDVSAEKTDYVLDLR